MKAVLQKAVRMVEAGSAVEYGNSERSYSLPFSRTFHFIADPHPSANNLVFHPWQRAQLGMLWLLCALQHFSLSLFS